MRRVRERLPNEDIIYLADQAHVPYGDRNDADLAHLLAQNVAYLEAEGADAVVVGCNTSCAVASRRGWPKANIPILDLIEAAARYVARSGAHNIGVIATAATARSGAYARAFKSLDTTLHVQEVAAPKLVPLVERGILTGPIVHQAVTESLAPFKHPLDALVLACTHYPLLDAEFAAILGPGIARIDPAIAQADAAVDFVHHSATTHRGTGSTRYATTGTIDTYRTAIESILGPLGTNDSVEYAAISTLTSDARR